MAEEVKKARAVAKYIRVAPRKARQVADLIRGARAPDAVNTLRFTTKASSKAFLKVMNSALANARQSAKLNEEDLYVSEVHVDQGPTLKRFRPRAMGRATRIRKRTSHITVVLSPAPAEMKKARAAKPAKAAPAKPAQAKAPEKRAAKKPAPKKPTVKKPTAKKQAAKQETKGEKRGTEG